MDLEVHVLLPRILWPEGRIWWRPWFREAVTALRNTGRDDIALNDGQTSRQHIERMSLQVASMLCKGCLGKFAAVGKCSDVGKERQVLVKSLRTDKSKVYRSPI